jgi:hypothetical protein
MDDTPTNILYEWMYDTIVIYYMNGCFYPDYEYDTPNKQGFFPASALDLLVVSVFRNHLKVAQCVPK